MKVILLQDVAKIGNRFDVKTVNDGYAVNYLIPRKLAEPATEKKLQNLEEKSARESEKVSAQEILLDENLQKLANTTLTIAAKANEQGHLFKGIHGDDIAAALAKETDTQLPKESVHIKEPIKELGEHKITLVAGGKEVALTLVVRGE